MRNSPKNKSHKDGDAAKRNEVWGGWDSLSNSAVKSGLPITHLSLPPCIIRLSIYTAELEQSGSCNTACWVRTMRGKKQREDSSERGTEKAHSVRVTGISSSTEYHPGQLICASVTIYSGSRYCRVWNAPRRRKCRKQCLSLQQHTQRPFHCHLSLQPHSEPCTVFSCLQTYWQAAHLVYTVKLNPHCVINSHENDTHPRTMNNRVTVLCNLYTKSWETTLATLALQCRTEENTKQAGRAHMKLKSVQCRLKRQNLGGARNDAGHGLVKYNHHN